ncbi:MAG: hypothetical protein IKL44_04820 [Clostridia bacterium]|nr:hypothetical protein [Clostridia bacterium]
MKKLLVLTFALMLLLCGCGKTESFQSSGTLLPDSSTPDTSSAVSEPGDNPYKDVIADYRNMVSLTGSDEFSYEEVIEFFDEKIAPVLKTNEEDMGEVYGSVLDYEVGPIEEFGYKLIDMDDDGTDELFLLKNDEYGQGILAFYTYTDGAPKLISVYWPRYNAVLTEGKLLYTTGSSGAVYVTMEVSKLENGKLVPIEVFGIDGYDEEKGKEKYFRTENNSQIFITEEEFDAISERYSDSFGPEWNASPIIPLK